VSCASKRAKLQPQAGASLEGFTIWTQPGVPVAPSIDSSLEEERFQRTNMLVANMAATTALRPLLRSRRPFLIDLLPKTL